MKFSIHTIIALLALIIGYPYGGNLFILAMIPYLIFMVFKLDAVYLPSLILHCASETSATTVVFISFMILSFINYNELIRLKLGILFWSLIGILPIFVWLVGYRIFSMSEYPPLAFVYIGYYLSFFAFFYGVLISKTFNREILRNIYILLFVVFLFFLTGAIHFTRIIVAFTYIYISSLSLLFTNSKKNHLLLAIALFSFLSVFASSEESTLTTMFVSLFAFFIALMYFKRKSRIIFSTTGYIAFILIFVLYFFGIQNYMNVDLQYVPQNTAFIDFNNFSNRVSNKFYSDRAPFWAGGFTQIIKYRHFFPIPDIPDIIAKFSTGREINITFGSHTTFIELVRKYGIIAGGVLGFSLINMVIISRKIFLIRNLNPLMIPVYATAIATTIVLSLTGQYQIMPGYALLSLGVLGIGFSKYSRVKNKYL